MKVLITGGAGFIGSAVSDRLLNEGHQVTIIDNYQTGRRENNSPHPGLKIVEGTIAHASLVEKTFHEFQPEVVLHAAASYKDPGNWEEDIATNITGTVNTVRASQKNTVKKFIYLQTSLCYGLQPLEKPVTLKHPLFSGKSAGGSSYAISKTGGEQYIALSGLDFISLRLANVYGPRNLSGPLPTFYHRLSNNLNCTIVNTRRDFIYIDDVVNVVMKTFLGTGKSRYYHASTGKDYSIRELFDLTIKHLGIAGSKGVEKEMEADDVSTILLDPAETNKDFNWKAETSLEEGVKKTIDWYKNNSPQQTYTHLKNIY